jgi:hypothetical protein
MKPTLLMTSTRILADAPLGRSAGRRFWCLLAPLPRLARLAAAGTCVPPQSPPRTPRIGILPHLARRARSANFQLVELNAEFQNCRERAQRNRAISNSMLSLRSFAASSAIVMNLNQNLKRRIER